MERNEDGKSAVLLFHWQCCLLILYILFCCLHCDCLGLAAIKWFLTAFETLNLLTYLCTRHVFAWDTHSDNISTQI